MKVVVSYPEELKEYEKRKKIQIEEFEKEEEERERKKYEILQRSIQNELCRTTMKAWDYRINSNNKKRRKLQWTTIMELLGEQQISLEDTIIMTQLMHLK